MGESDPACSVVTKEANSGSRSSKKHHHRRFVDYVREGFRKISGYKETSNNLKRLTAAQKNSKDTPGNSSEKRKAGGVVLGAKRRKDALGGGSREHIKKKTTFESFLSTLPKTDAVDRTVGWIYQQPIEWTKDPVSKSLATLPQRGRIVPFPQLPMTRVSTVSYETSISHYESERGTHGRGTPPPLDMDQPRLDDLFRQLHVKQEHQARKKLAKQGEVHLSSRNLRDIESAQVLGYPPGVTPELLPFLSQSSYRAEPPSLLHKNSFYYNQVDAEQLETLLDTHSCEWGNCRMRFSSGRELFDHIQTEHISVLPSYHSKYKVHSSRGHQLICRWRGCFEVFDARYKLFLHAQNAHFKDYLVAMTKPEDENHPPSGYNTHPTKKPVTKHHSSERSSLHVSRIPFPDLSRQTTRQGRKKRGESQHRTILHHLQSDRTLSHDYRPSGR